MDITQIGAASGFPSLAPVGGGGSGTGGFGALLDQAISSLETTQANADAAIETFALGGDIELHDVLIATEMEALSVQLAMQFRNRFVETVQTVLNMQV